MSACPIFRRDFIPALCALSSVRAAAASSISAPIPSNLAVLSTRSIALVRSSRHVSDGIQLHFSAAKRLLIPGAILSAFRAASIRSVPLPQNGSHTIESGRTLARSIIPAASVSLIGAAFEFLL